MPFTAEDLMAMQEEAEAAAAAASPDVAKEVKVENVNQDDTKKEEVKDDGKTGKEEAGKEGGEDGKGSSEKGKEEVKIEEKKEEKKEETFQDDEEVRELRELNKTQEVKLDRVTREYERLMKIMKDKGLIDEDEEKLRTDQEAAARANYERRLATLNDMLEVMKVNPKYEDVDTVVSQHNFDDMVAALAKFHVSKNGGDLNQVLREVEKEIWGLPNPYKYMYDMIKKYHPTYATKKESIVEDIKKDLAGSGKEEKKEEAAKADKKPEEQAMSLQDLPGGGGKESGGWTSEKIDALDEDELTKVPKDIYEKYLLGTLK